MKYLKTKNSRRRGVAIELAMMLFLAMTAVTILVVNTTMIQANRQKQSYSDLTEVVDGFNEEQLTLVLSEFIMSASAFEYANTVIDGVRYNDLEIDFLDSVSSTKIGVVTFNYMSTGLNGEVDIDNPLFVVSFHEVVDNSDKLEPYFEYYVQFEVTVENNNRTFTGFNIIGKKTN